MDRQTTNPALSLSSSTVSSSFSSMGLPFNSARYLHAAPLAASASSSAFASTAVANADPVDACLAYTRAPLLELENSIGTLVQSSFTHSTVGAIGIFGGSLNVQGCVFTDNRIATAGADSALFPELRHNIIAEGGASIVLDGIAREDPTVPAYWVVPTDVDTTVELKNADPAPEEREGDPVWMFVPKLLGAAITESVSEATDMQEEMNVTTVVITGSLLVPCSIQAVIVRRSVDAAPASASTSALAHTQSPTRKHAHTRTPFNANINTISKVREGEGEVAYTGTLHPANGNLANSTQAELTLPRREVFNPVGSYFLYLAYGPGGRYHTAEIYLKLGDGFDIGGPGGEKSKGKAAFPIWVIFVILGVFALVIGAVVVLFILWRRQKRKTKDLIDFDTSENILFEKNGDQLNLHDHKHTPATGKEKRVTLIGDDRADTAGPEPDHFIVSGGAFGIQSPQAAPSGVEIDQFASADKQNDPQERVKAVREILPDHTMERSLSSHDPVDDDGSDADAGASLNSTSAGGMSKSGSASGGGSHVDAAPMDSEADIARAEQALAMGQSGSAPAQTGTGTGARTHRHKRRDSESGSDTDSVSSSSGSGSGSGSSRSSRGSENGMGMENKKKKKKKKKKAQKNFV